MARPTMEDVAEAAGVSRALVSLVMRNEPNVSAHRRQAVLEAADRLGYRPNVLARNLASHRTMTLGVMLNDLNNPFFAGALDGIAERAEAEGYQLMLTTGGKTVAGEAGALETMLRFHVDGLILVGARIPANEIVAAAAVSPTVLLGRALRSSEVDSVKNDEGVGSRLAVQHLVELGHQRIAHIDGGRGAGAAQRRAGYEKAMEAAGLAAFVEVVSGDFSEAGGVHGAATLLDQEAPPTAIFAANDLCAVGARSEIRRRGFSVPEDFSLVGYDNSVFAELGHLSLTSVSQPLAEMGHRAAELLFERLVCGRTEVVRHVVTPTLAVRATTGSPRGNL